MGNEMGNNNTSGLKDEENTAVETCKTSLVDTTHENDKKEKHRLVPEVEGKDFHDEFVNLASDDPKRIGDPCVENQTSSIEVDMTIEHQNTEVHPLGETPKVAMKSTEAWETESRLQSDTSLNDLAHEKPIEKSVEETGIQGTMQYKLEKKDSLKKCDEEDGTIPASDGLQPKENITVEACITSLPESSRENDANEENHIGVEVDENVSYLATDDTNMTEDSCIENHISCTKEQEDSDVPPLGEFLQVTIESTEVCEEDSKVQPVTLLSDAGHEEPIEQKKKETDIQPGTMQHQLDKQDCLKKEHEEDIVSTSHDLEAKESKHIESNQQELVTIHADQSVEVGSGSLLGSKDSLGPSFASDFEVIGLVLHTETLKNREESADSSPDPALESQGDALSELKACREHLKSSEEQLETKDGEEAESGFSNITATASYDLIGLENKCSVELPSEVNLIDNPKSEPEVLLLSNSHLEVPEPMDKGKVLLEEIILAGKEMVNGEEKLYTDQTQPYLQSGMESESDCDLSSESLMVEPTHDKSETISFINPSSNKVCQPENPKVIEDGNLVFISVSNQHEASKDQLAERKLDVVPEVGIISPEIGIPHFSHKEEELVGKRNVQERENNTEPSVAIEMEETERAEHNCLPLQESTVEMVLNDSITELKQENSGEFFATKNPTVDFTSWIAEALDSMNNLEAEMLSQQVTQHKEAHQAEVAAAESKAFVEVETSTISVNSGSETHETMGRSSTMSTESDPDNCNIGHSRIQKSPSFSLDLQNEARSEESDSTPLLFHDKVEIESLPSQCEKVTTLERSESEESKTPFLGFPKEEEETRIVKPKIHDNNYPAENSTKNLGGSLSKTATKSSSKRKEKRRHRPSLFSSCLCCATVIN